MSDIMTKDELDRFSAKFLCQLFKKTGGNLDMSIGSAELVFESVTVGAFERPFLAASIGNRISHHLLKQGLIRKGYLANEVRLTREGLQKCIETCRDL